MRTISIINQKGGCGKTTVSINLAATLAARGHRTLLVDMDPQGHCALGLAVPDEQVTRSVADLLAHGLDGTIGLPDITWQISKHLDLCPASMSLAGLEPRLTGVPDRDRRLAQVLAPAADRYRFVVIDCPPSIGLLTFNALRAADEVLIPVETGYFAMQGSVRQTQTIRMLARRVGHHVRFGVLPTMYDVRTKLAREILAELKKHFPEDLLPLVINFNSKLKEAASFGQPITEYDPSSRGMEDFEELADWLMAHPPPRPPEEAAVERVLGEVEDEQPSMAGVAGMSDGTSHRSAPGMSRAAELVERARALSARSAALQARIAAEARDDEQLDATPAGEAANPAEPDVQTMDAAMPAGPTISAAGMQPATAGPLVIDRSPAEATATTDAPAPATPARREQLARLFGVRPVAQGALFVQPTDLGQTISVAGDFNNWDPHGTPLRRDERLGVLQARVDIRPGRYRYRLVIDGRWTPDPHNQAVEDNGMGGVNNVLEVV